MVFGADGVLDHLPQGHYRVMVLDVAEEGTDAGQQPPQLSLVVLEGDYRAQVVSMPQLEGMQDAVLLLGEHGTLSVSPNGVSLRLD